ncbi:MAG: DUF4058 family protein [Chloroflexi bacterium]|nr:DUF4058 family protein [Chloroflexota bacterium]
MARSPFPGMDPYLEDPAIFPDLHERLIGIIAEQLSPRLAPKYVAELNTHMLIDEEEPDRKSIIPDVTVAKLKEAAVAYAATPIEPVPVRVPLSFPTRVTRVEIRKSKHQALVTVIEILSPVNKRPGNGRTAYKDKRATLFQSRAHYIEIDLLRKYPRMPFEGNLPPSDYLAVVCNGDTRPHCDAYPIMLRQHLPVLPIPLLQPDPPVPLDLQDALVTAYERARYDLRVNYREPPDPPLGAEDVEWASALLAKQS